ncbi:DUF2332 family protein [Curtobacterium sp. RRHDQ10]|uniref:DUF2332 family protein n=1 Tax=Curtobacterium phyllosphaerae TaxID=3413379 RepID=UPI003BF4511E
MVASGTADRYTATAGRLVAAWPTYAAWARSVASAADVVAVLDRLPPTKRQPELVFAVARRLGADPVDPTALVRLLRTRPDEVVQAASLATMQANDPRRLAAVLPLFARMPGPIGLLDVGVSAGLCSVPDHVVLDYVTDDGPVRMTSSTAQPSFALSARATGRVPEPFVVPAIAGRVGLDPAPIDLREPRAFDRLVEAVPPEATDRTALMRAAARATLAAPPVRITGRVPDDLDRALAALPSGCTPVVMTTGTLVYVPGAERQAFVDRVTALGVHWVAMERTGILHGVASTLPDGVDPGDPDAFATVSFDGVAVALADAHGTTVRWI